jgi:ankyrin repeat protein
VQLLLDQGADFNAQGGHYDNALQTAATEGRQAIVQLLLDQGAEVNAQGGVYGIAREFWLRRKSAWQEDSLW